MQRYGPARLPVRFDATGPLDSDSPASYSCLLRNFFIRISYHRQVRRSRPGVQIRKKRIVAPLSLQFGDLTVRIVNVSKNNCFSGTDRGTSGDDFTIANRAVFPLGVDFGVLNALDAISAFFHYTATAYCNFGIAHQFICWSIPVLVQQEIEAPNFVWTVIRAVSGTDTAVINHVVQALRTVNRGMHRAHRLAWRVFTMHTRHRHEIRPFRTIFVGTTMIAVYAQPVHFTPALNLFFAH